MAFSAAMASAWPARASEAARLVYARTPSAASCPDERGFRAAVAERLGYDPFFPWAEQTVSVDLFEERGVLRARLELIDRNGIVRGSRQLEGATRDCHELIDSLALATSITLDPMTVRAHEARRPSAEVEGTPKSGGEVVAQPADTSGEVAAKPTDPSAAEGAGKPAHLPGPSAADRDRAERAEPAVENATTRVSLRAGPFVAFGEGPAPSSGLQAAIVAARRSWALAAELRAGLPTSIASSEGGEAHVAVMGGSLAPCFVRAIWSGCALVFLGQMATRGSDVASPADETFFYAAAGARIEAAIPVTSAFDLILHFDGTKTLTPARLYLHEREVWRTPVASAAAGAAAGIHFP